MDFFAIQNLNPLLGCFEAAEFDGLVASGRLRQRSYDAGFVIHFDSDRCDRLEIILKGSVLVERIGEDGRSLMLDRPGPGAILGGNLMFSANPVYPMTISAITRVSLLEVETEVLFALLCAKPVLLRAYLEQTALRTLLLGERVKERVKITLRATILRYLEHESQKQGSRMVMLPITKKELALRLGVERSSLSRELAKMAADGLVLVEGRRIALL